MRLRRRPAAPAAARADGLAARAPVRPRRASAARRRCVDPARRLRGRASSLGAARQPRAGAVAACTAAARRGRRPSTGPYICEMTPAEAPVGRLVVCPTPIGNLEDVTLRVLGTLREADVIACEDTRHTRVLLDRHGIAAQLVSLHEHNERARAGELVERIARGRDRRAGLRRRHAADLRSRLRARARVPRGRGSRSRCCPGPSAVLTALVASGLPAERWRFVGFLPRARGELRALLERRRRDARRVRVAAAPGRARSRCSPSSIRSARWRSAAS